MRFAVGLPNTPWVPERAVSFARLQEQMGKPPTGSALRVFDEREPNWSWSQRMFAWACESDCDFLLQCQDDVMVAPEFWTKLRAMVESVPDQVISLQSPHPLGPEQFRAGRRWYRTCAWLLGVAWVWPLDPKLPQGLPNYRAWCKANPERVQTTNEDTLASQWLAENKFSVWHPCPTIVDHDISVPSTYGNDDHHEFSMYRRSTVTWRDVPRVEALNEKDYWLHTAAPPLLPGPGTQVCWFCNERQSFTTSASTGARLCAVCLLNMHGTWQLQMGMRLGMVK